MVTTAKNFLIMLNNFQQMHVKLLQKNNSKNGRSNWLFDGKFKLLNWTKTFHFIIWNDAHQRSYERYFLPNVDIKDCNVMIDGKTLFDHPVKNDLITHENIWKITIGQGHDYTIGCLLDCNCSKNYYKIIPIDLSKQKALDANPKATQQINFTGNLN